MTGSNFSMQSVKFVTNLQSVCGLLAVREGGCYDLTSTAAKKPSRPSRRGWSCRNSPVSSAMCCCFNRLSAGINVNRGCGQGRRKDGLSKENERTPLPVLIAGPQAFHNPNWNHHPAIHYRPLWLTRPELPSEHPHNFPLSANLTCAQLAIKNPQNILQRTSPSGTTTT